MTATIRVAVRKFEPFESAILKQFEDFARASHAAVRIEIEALDLNPLHERLFEKRELSDGTWDAAFISTDWIAEAQAHGLIEDLTPHLARAPIADFPEAWSKSLLQLQSFSGGFWGMPYHDGPECLIYRKDLLESAGLAVPTTWDKFVATARRLHAPDKGLYGTALALYPDGHNGFYDFCIHVWTRGGEPFGPDARPDLVTPQAIAALDFLRALAVDRLAIVPNPRELDSVQVGLLFRDGKIALMTNWFGFAALGDSTNSPVRGRVGIAPLPADAGGRSVSLNVFWVLSIAAGSRNKPLVWDFLRHCATAPMDKLTTLEGAIGVRRSTWADPEVNRIAPYYHKLESLHEHAREIPPHPRLAEIAHVIDAVLTAALTTTRASRDLLGDAQLMIEGIVK